LKRLTNRVKNTGNRPKTETITAAGLTKAYAVSVSRRFLPDNRRRPNVG
jgi:hypothetical protein